MRLKLWGVIFSLSVLLTLLPATAYAADNPPTSGSCGQGVTWQYDQNSRTLTISGTGAMDDYQYDGSESTAPWAGWVGIHGYGVDTIVVEDGVTYIGNAAFSQARFVKTLNIGKDVARIGTDNAAILSSVFPSSWNTPAITVDGANPAYCSENGTLYDKDKTTLIRCFSGNIESFDVPASVRVIGYEAFRVCSNLKTVTLPDGLTSIGASAFFQATGLETIRIPNSVTKMERSAFDYCTNLKEVTIGTGIQTIGEYAFYNCDGLKKMTIGADTPPTAAKSSFPSGTAFEIYVPSGKGVAYQAAPGWGSYADKIIDPHEHIWNWVIDKEATENETGLKHEECTVCKEKRNENTVVDKSAHQHTAVYHKAVAATCQAEGSIEYRTCDTPGCKGKYYADEACTKEITTGIKTAVNPNNHVGAATLKNAQAATTSQKGYTGDKVCKACGNVIEKGKEIPVIVDKKTTTTAKEAAKEVNKSPKTGDTNSVWLCVAALGISFVGAVTGFLTYQKRKR